MKHVILLVDELYGYIDYEWDSVGSDPYYQIRFLFNNVIITSALCRYLLSDILKKFNPNVFGFSKGISKRPNGFNMAVSGAKAR